MSEAGRYWAPGRVNLIGEHTDHTGGLVLPAAIDLGITLEVDELGGDQIVLASADAHGLVSVQADGATPPATGWGRYVAAVAAELAALGRAPLGMRGRLSSTLPQGAGLSSSAALEVVVALALADIARLELDPIEVAELCRRAEHRAVGLPSGIMDQATSILGRAGHAIFLDCGSLAHRLVPLPIDHVMLILDSGVRRELASTAYAARTRELGAAMPVLGGRRPSDVTTAELAGMIRDLDPILARRLRHVVTENVRVRDAERALRDGDLTALGSLFSASHASLRDDFEVTVPELDMLVDLALRSGATAARMTGGGFGGSVVALVRADAVATIADAVLRAFARGYPHRSGRAHICVASGGARRIV